MLKLDELGHAEIYSSHEPKVLQIEQRLIQDNSRDYQSLPLKNTKMIKKTHEFPSLPPFFLLPFSSSSSFPLAGRNPGPPSPGRQQGYKGRAARQQGHRLGDGGGWQGWRQGQGKATPKGQGVGRWGGCGRGGVAAARVRLPPLTSRAKSSWAEGLGFPHIMKSPFEFL